MFFVIVVGEDRVVMGEVGVVVVLFVVSEVFGEGDCIDGLDFYSAPV